MTLSILKESQALSEQITKWRRGFHANPELGFQEYQTAQFVVDVLEEFGFESIKQHIGRTGVVATLGSGSPCIALRADMDALPISDKKKVAYASKNSGISHACGHDAHMAMLLGAAKILSNYKNNFHGEVRFIFQPFEEGQNEEGIGGADAMMKDNVLDGVDVIIGQHVHGELPAGSFQIKDGFFSAAVDTFHGVIKGKGCHGAYPHNGRDPIFIAAQVINAVQGIISRRIDPLEPAVISFGKICAGTAPNIIPDEVEVEGTIRSLDPKIRAQLKEYLEKVFQLTRTFGGDYQLNVTEGYLSIENKPELVKLLREVATEFLPSEKILEGGLGMGAEDFAVFSSTIPGAFFYLGAGLDPPRVHHSPEFDIDDSILYLGTSILAETAIRFLKSQI
jgi:amidohydrolase